MRSKSAERPAATALASEEHVAGDVEGGCDSKGLIDGFDPGGTRIVGPLEVHRPTFELDLSFVGDHGPGDAFDERRLAGAVVTDDPEHLTGIELEVGADKRGHPPEALDQTTRHQDRYPLIATRAHLPTLRIHWSNVTATRINAPIAKFW